MRAKGECIEKNHLAGTMTKFRTTVKHVAATPDNDPGDVGFQVHRGHR
jgi:hypothetical protein